MTFQEKHMDIEYREFTSKPELYRFIHEKLRLIGEESSDFYAVLSNAAALLWLELPDVNWSGFYLYKDGRLVLGPFQGKPAVAEISIGKGVCGTAAGELTTQVVEDVHSCCNHIACDLSTSSEIVVPIIATGRLVGVIDIDSPVTARFDEQDKAGLETAADILAGLYLKA